MARLVEFVAARTACAQRLRADLSRDRQGLFLLQGWAHVFRMAVSVPARPLCRVLRMYPPKSWRELILVFAFCRATRMILFSRHILA